MKKDEVDAPRDEALGELLRTALDDLGPRDTPDFDAVYARAEGGPIRLEGPSSGPSRRRRWGYRLAFALPVAAALAFTLNLGGDSPLRNRDSLAAFREELSFLVAESVGPDWRVSPDIATAADPVTEELASFVTDLWNRSEDGGD